MRFAYADPPYLGCSGKYPEKREVDHVALIARLVAEYPDGWALSCHSPSLRVLLPLCPEDVRVMAWTKTYANLQIGAGACYAWEPILVRGGRRRARRSAERLVFDWVSCPAAMTPGFTGAKPTGFAMWLFSVLNMQPGDEFHDLFPGTGAVTKAWEAYQRQIPMAYAAP